MSVKKVQRLKQTHVSSKIKHLAKIKHQERNGKISTNKEPKNSSKNDKKALVIAHEIKFAKLLAGNDKKVRDKVLKNLKKWLTIRSESSFAFVEQDFMRLWKGLYYCMWMSDKPLIQEELAESVSKLVHCFNDKEVALLYTKCTLFTLASEWFGIDQHRLDKFQMLVRRIMRQTFEMCKKRSWDRQWVEGVGKIIENLLTDSKTTVGFSLHITELYMEELSKVSRGEIPKEMVMELVRPFAIHLAGMNDERQIRHVMKHIFRYLLFQSDVGLDYVEKFEAWRHAGFPKGNIDAMEKVEIDDDDEDNNEDDSQESDNGNQTVGAGNQPLDPRAGRVDVELPQLPFDAKAIAKLVMSYRFHPTSTTKTRRQILRIAKEFNELSEGKMPIGIKQVKLREGSKAETNSKSAALRLIQFEKDLYSDTIRTKRKKKNVQIVEEDVASDSESVPQMKKKAKSENLVNNTKKYNDDDTVAKENAMESEKIKAKSKAVDKAKIKPESFKKFENGQVETGGKTRKRKQKKLAANKQNGEVENKLLQEQNVKKGLKRLINTLKPKKTHSDKESQLFTTPIKKAGIETPSKKVKRDSSDGSWSVSENLSPISPSTQNLIIPTPSFGDNSHSVNLLPSNNTTSWLTPKKVNLEASKPKTPEVKTPEAQMIKEISSTSSSSAKKKVKIVLQRNTAQHTSEYMRQLRQSPAIPFDAKRKPPVGVLKPSPIPSPVNPFYKRGFKL